MNQNSIMIPAANHEDGLYYADVRELPCAVHGLIYENGAYRRMPEAVAKAVSSDVYGLHANTSGGRLRLITDSKRMGLRVKVDSVTRFDHMPLTGTLGFDVYRGERYLHTFRPPADVKDEYSAVVGLHSTGEGEYTLNFPLYNNVVSVEMGLEPGSVLKMPEPYAKAPVLFYGSSITQGGCASRPGLCFANILSRDLECDIWNLGFSGSAKGETVMAEYIAGLPMSVFVYDYEHNAPNADHLEKTHGPFLDLIRAARPDLPILLLTRPDAFTTDFGGNENIRRHDIIENNWKQRVAAGDTNLYFIDGKELWDGDHWYDCTVDSCHPNDLGFYRMAQVILPVLRAMLGRKPECAHQNKSDPPIDSLYGQLI